MDQIVEEVTQSSRITPVILRQTVLEKTEISFHIAHVRKLMHQYDLSPKRITSVHIRRDIKNAIRSW